MPKMDSYQSLKDPAHGEAGFTNKKLAKGIKRAAVAKLFMTIPFLLTAYNFLCASFYGSISCLTSYLARMAKAEPGVEGHIPANFLVIPYCQKFYKFVSPSNNARTS